MPKSSTICCRISEAQRAYLEELGDGKVSVGLDRLLSMAMSKSQPVAAKKTAAPPPAKKLASAPAAPVAVARPKFILRR